MILSISSTFKMSDKDGNKAEESEHSEDDESDILEESPCGRWLKRNEEVSKQYTL